MARGPSKAQPTGAAGDGEHKALGDQLVGRAGLLAGAVGVQQLRRELVDLGQRPGAGLAHDLLLVAPKDAARLRRLDEASPFGGAAKDAAEPPGVKAQGANRGRSRLALGEGAAQPRLRLRQLAAKGVLRGV